jgi:hypothetical protein
MMMPRHYQSGMSDEIKNALHSVIKHECSNTIAAQPLCHIRTFRFIVMPAIASAWADYHRRCLVCFGVLWQKDFKRYALIVNRSPFPEMYDIAWLSCISGN